MTRIMTASAIGMWLALGAVAVHAQEPPRIQRVRSESALLTSAIAEGSARSQTFRRLVHEIESSDGLVYVLEGRCPEGVRACLNVSVQLAGPNRLLRILVNPRRAPGCELIGSIGHELRHAVEVLSDHRVTTPAQMHGFFSRIGSRRGNRFETDEAIAIGVAVEREMC